MEFYKTPLWRVPVVLGTLGIFCRILSLGGGILWGTYLRAQGPDPETGKIILSSGPVPAIVAVVSCVLFWWAGWRFVQGLTRRQIFLSATIMVVFHAVLLAAEQIGQSMGGYPLTVYHLYALTEGTLWVSQLLIRLFDDWSLLLACVSVLAPYLYIVFGKKGVPQ